MVTNAPRDNAQVMVAGLGMQQFFEVGGCQRVWALCVRRRRWWLSAGTTMARHIDNAHPPSASC